MNMNKRDTRAYVYFNMRLDEDENDDDELVRAGIDPEAMGYLTGSERRKILVGAGLDPRKYDF